MVEVFREVRRVLRSTGVAFINYGDCYWSGSEKRDGGHGFVDGGKKKLNDAKGSLLSKRPNCHATLKPKDLVMMPARIALALQADGWWVRSDIIWAKGISFCPTYSGSVLPESCRDRPTSAYEHVFLLTKNSRYFYDAVAVRENFSDDRMGNPQGGGQYAKQAYGNNPQYGLAKGEWTRGPELGGRNLRNVWAINPEAFKGSHFATFPTKLVTPCIKSGTSERGCCRECGAPWERDVEKQSFGKEHSETKFDDTMQGGPVSRSRQAYRKHGLEGPPAPTTTGWHPTCTCDAGEPVPCTVLDPFAGSGTTGLVADRLGRDAVLIELNEDYARMARRRIYEDSPLFADVKMI